MLQSKIVLLPKVSFIYGEELDAEGNPIVLEPKPAPKPPKPAPKSEAKYTEEDLNNRTGNLRKSLETKLEREASNHKATQAERDAAASELESLRAEYTSKETLAAQALSTAEKKHKAEMKAEKEAREKAETDYATLLIDNELTREEALVKPSIPGALADAMRAKTKLVDEINEVDGKKTGKKVVRLEFDDLDKDGKPIKSLFPVKDAFKRMKELPVRYGIYFEGVGAGGIGGNNGKGNNGKVLPAGELPKGIDDYAKIRKEQRKQNS